LRVLVDLFVTLIPFMTLIFDITGHRLLSNSLSLTYELVLTFDLEVNFKLVETTAGENVDTGM